jgi:hypothetical protein
MNLNHFLVLGIYLLALSPLRAFGAEDIYRLKGAEVSYGVQVDGPKRLRLEADFNLQWVIGSDHITCEELFSHSSPERCSISIVQPHFISINEFKFPADEIIFLRLHQWGESVSNEELEKLKRDSQASIPERLLAQLSDVKSGTVYWREGSCFTKQLRFFADDQTKIISKLWFEKVGTPCR